MERRLALSLFCCFVLGLDAAAGANVGCQHVKFAFATKGLNANDVPATAMTGKFNIYLFVNQM
jgi:hypothetical protein